MNAKFYIVTGLSGAGKSQALKILEDAGIFCVDNLPVILVPKFADLYRTIGGKLSQVALGIDVRSGKSFFSKPDSVLGELKARGIKYKILFFTADNSTLLKRYSETRRKHPLGERVIEGIKKERLLMKKIVPVANKIIDTSNLSLKDLKEVLSSEVNVRSENRIVISIMSFGYKYGIPPEADLIMDVRFLPNPNYIPGLRVKTGRDNAVKRFIKKNRVSRVFSSKFTGLIKFLMPNYIKEGKNYLTVAIGCTGGRHRSVAVAEELAKFLKNSNYTVHIYHRDIGK